jgi:hypothetical protein
VGIVYADVPGLTTDTIPLALTGNLAGFGTGSPTYGDTTLHSTSVINSGSFVHLVITRDIASGTKAIYVNGNLEGTAGGALEALNARNQLFLGANQTDARYFVGLMDDFQLYDAALTAEEVRSLYDHPGLTLTEIPELAGAAGWLGLGAGLLALFRRASRRVLV